MKKRWRIWIAALLCLGAFVALGAATALGEEDAVYRHWDEETGILTFDGNFDYNKETKEIPGLDRETLLDRCAPGDIQEIRFACKVPVKNGRELFAGCSALQKITGMENLDTSKVTDMSGMFLKCDNLTELDLSGFDTSRVTDMSGMFAYCPSLTMLDLSGFDTSRVTDMSGMFCGCSSLSELDLSGYNTSHVTDMSDMFCGCSSLSELDLSSFETARVQIGWLMFDGCDKLQTLTLRKDFGEGQVLIVPRGTEIQYVSAPTGAAFRRAFVWISQNPGKVLLCVFGIAVAAVIVTVIVPEPKKRKPGQK